MSTATRTRLLAQLARIELQIEAANVALDDLVTKSVESYTFESGDGKQSAKRVDTSKFDQLISVLEQRAEHIRQRLGGLGLVNMNVRRKEGL